MKKDTEGSLPAGWRENYDARTAEQDAHDEAIRAARIDSRIQQSERWRAERKARDERETADPTLKEVRLQNEAEVREAARAALAEILARGKAGDLAAMKEYERRRKRGWRAGRWVEAYNGERSKPKSWSGTPGSKRNRQRPPAYYAERAHRLQAQAIALGVIDASKLADLLEAASGRAEQCGDSAGADVFGYAAKSLRSHENKALSTIASLSPDIGDSWNMVSGRLYYRTRPATRQHLVRQIAAALETKANLIADAAGDALLTRQLGARPARRLRRQ